MLAFLLILLTFKVSYHDAQDGDGKDKIFPMFSRQIQNRFDNTQNCGKSTVASNFYRIVNGENARVNEFPWMAGLLINGQPMCGASVIDRHWLVTAAHCLEGLYRGDTVYVKLGNNNIYTGQRFYIPPQNIFLHPRYGGHQNYYNDDIALLKTRSPMPVGTAEVNEICMPAVRTEPRSSQLLVSGWGYVHPVHMIPADWLKKVRLDIISDEECAAYHNIRRGQVCTWKYNQDACNGDSGGPAIEYRNGRAYLVGIVSYGSGCASPYPTVFTQVSYYIPWIDETISYYSLR